MHILRIFLAEDHAVVREGLKLLVSAQPDMQVVGEAGDGQAAVQQVLKLVPDLVVMDISMPELNGAQAARQLLEARPGIKILALSVHEDKSYLREMLSAGVKGYVLKRSAAEDLINAIRVVANHGVYIDPSLAGQVVTGFVKNGPNVAEVKENTLSLREREVLRLVSQGFSQKEIAQQLNISIKTVETYKSRAMVKTGLQSRSDIVRYAVEHGWLQG